MVGVEQEQYTVFESDDTVTVCAELLERGSVQSTLFRMVFTDGSATSPGIYCMYNDLFIL